MEFTPSERCTISCGTVCVDPRAGKVLIIFNRRLGIWQLPKGRKNIGEDLHSAALRETYEETGVPASLLPLMVQTRSTKPPVESWAPHKSSGNPCDSMTHRTAPSIASVSSTSTACSTSTASSASSTAAVEGVTTAEAIMDPNVTSNRLNTEPVGIVRYPDLQVSTPGTMKTVFFFAAYADSTAPMGAGAQEDHEDLLAEWVEYQVADKRLRFVAETEAMWKVKNDIARTG